MAKAPTKTKVVNANLIRQASKASTPNVRLYSTYRWQKKRKAQLHAEPLCAMCEAKGIVTLARVADHVLAHRGNEESFWNGALQSLCFTCHNSTKQRIERRSGGRSKV